MSAYGKIASLVWLWGVAAVPARNSPSIVKLCSATSSLVPDLRTGLSGSESENGAQAQDHNRTFSSCLIGFAVGEWQSLAADDPLSAASAKGSECPSLLVPSASLASAHAAN